MSAADSIAKVGGGVKNLAIGVGLIGAIGAVVYVGYTLYSNREKFNPVSDKNLAYQGTNTVVQALTGDPHTTVGASAYDAVQKVKGWFSWGETDAERLRREAMEASVRRRLETHPL